MTSASLDLTRRHFQRNRGSLTFIGSWIRDHEEERYAPVMVIMRAGEELKPGTIPCIIPMDVAWMWDPSIGDMVTVAQTVGEFMAMLRMDFTERDAIRFVNNVHDMLADLLLMPRTPPGAEPEIIADLLATDLESGTERHIEVKRWH